MASNEIYGRYIDDIFFTSNESLMTINRMLDEANNLHPNIKLVRQIGTSVSFLDLFIENKDGVLTTSVYHEEAPEPYILPFNSGHSRHIFSNIIENALIRAVRYSSSFLQNSQNFSYPPRCVYSRCNQFFASHFRISVLLRTIYNENKFQRLRSLLLNRPTIPEYRIASRVAKAIKADPTEKVTNPLVRAQLKKQSKFDGNLIIHYTHEKRLQKRKRHIHKLWNKTFEETPVIGTRLIIGKRNSRNLTGELVHHRLPTPQKFETNNKLNQTMAS